MSTIELHGVTKHWGGSTALHGVSAHIPGGSFCVLLGPSGCGKSTTLRILAGLESASSGQVLIGGRDVTALPPAQRGIAMVFQNYALFPHLSVADNIGFGLQVRKTPPAEARQSLQEAAELLGLTPLLARKPAQLSGGQQQRVALARALVARAQVCLMDEPLSNLDAQLRQDMRTELRELQQRLGLTVVYVTHDQAEAMAMADQVLLLNAGRIEQAAPPRVLYAEPATLFAGRFIGTPAMSVVPTSALPGHVARPANACWLGLRPEALLLTDPDHAGATNHLHVTVHGLEYLGADLVLHCQLGEHPLTVRTPGHTQALPGQTLTVRWAAHDSHFFDVQGNRLSAAPSVSVSALSSN